MTEYQKRTAERLVKILRSESTGPRSWQAEAANEIERLLEIEAAYDHAQSCAEDRKYD